MTLGNEDSKMGLRRVVFLQCYPALHKCMVVNGLSALVQFVAWLVLVSQACTVQYPLPQAIW